MNSIVSAESVAMENRPKNWRSRMKLLGHHHRPRMYVQLDRIISRGGVWEIIGCANLTPRTPRSLDPLADVLTAPAKFGGGVLFVAWPPRGSRRRVRLDRSEWPMGAATPRPEFSAVGP